ncbi:hypothetical protein TorRG33x02_097990 [Trema orientale]|uniref:Uncharacterized protein n=1 Tax=Trema orientale TaxID=63057 RepID=A0A2P5F949_TREOI|nr:hypothetical protein TorRG33x02_097990 [Trema orientale]
MEQENDHDHHIDQNYRPRILNFNAPLLSTRRPPNYPTNSIEVLSCPSLRRRNSTSVNDRVPFSWEKAPGKPKDDHKNDNDTFHDQNDTPRPKLPPGLLWRYRQKSGVYNDNNDDIDNDDGCEADVEDEEDENDDVFNDKEDEVFSDAVDVFSLSEAIDIVERSEKAREMKTTDGLKLKIIEDSRSGAAARAHHGYGRKTTSVTRSITRTTSYSSSSKGCGFEMLFPWRVKHKWICGVKGPVRPQNSFSTSTMQLRHKKR